MSEDCFIDLLRHGEPEGGTRFRGARDDPPSALGREQVRLATLQDRAGWTRIWTSPARRCAEPAHALARELGLPIEEHPWLRECGFGDWEGLTPDEIPAAALARFWADPVRHTPPGAEPFTEFRARVLEGWNDRLRSRDPHTLVVTHGGVIRVLLAEVLQMPADALLLIEVPYACRTRLRIPAAPWRPSLVYHGVVPVAAPVTGPVVAPVTSG